jgi:hypothetical protein
MKNLTILLLFAISLTSFGQKKYVTDSIKVYGNCEMCEERIEDEIDIVGVRAVNWNVETKMLTIIYSPAKISIEEIHQLCADIGHSTTMVKASEDAYEALHHCCKYVVHDHEGHEHG